MPRPAVPHHTARSVVVAAALLGAASCRDSSAPADQAMLPMNLAVRSDTPYILGTITEGPSVSRAHPRILVVASGGSRVDRAWVTVHPDSTLVWRDGRKATPGDLTVGRSVVVWVRGPELRSYPVQVTGSAILIENPR